MEVCDVILCFVVIELLMVDLDDKCYIFDVNV